jgi:replicative DNA helicase
VATQREPQQIFDRLPPQNIDAERSVLGAMLLNADAVGTAIELLREKAEEVFYAEAHQEIYAAIVTLFRKSVPIDVLTLTEQLTRDNHLDSAGGASYIAELSNAVPTSANVEYYARIVLDAAILRRLISTCSRITGEAYSSPDDVNAVLDQAEANIFSIAEVRQLNPIHKVADLLEDSIHRIEEIIKSHAGYTGVPTGYKRLDEMLSGLQPSDMIVLAARPSVGKTAFALNVAAHIAVQSAKSVLLFSLEMSKEQLVQRLLCMEGRINSKKLRTGFLAGSEFPKLQRASDNLSRAEIYIDDTPNIGLLDLRSKARRHASLNPCDLIIIDYLQLMRGAGRVESRQVEIAEISRSVKGLARELRVPVIALSQLSREAEKDDMGSPKLSHLRESGAIEQDADVVMMLSRPNAAKRKGIEEKCAGDVDVEGIIQLDIAKQRNGPTGTVFMMFDRDIQRFGELAFGMQQDAGPIPPDDSGAGYDADDIYEPLEEAPLDEEPFDPEDDTPF